MCLAAIRVKGATHTHVVDVYLHSTITILTLDMYTYNIHNTTKKHTGIYGISTARWLGPHARMRGHINNSNNMDEEKRLAFVRACARAHSPEPHARALGPYTHAQYAYVCVCVRAHRSASVRRA